MAPIVSKDERIDLTQFDGYTKPDEKLFLEEMQEAFERAVVLEETVSDADANLALFAPHLLAELKRMYEREDALLTAINALLDSADDTGCTEDLSVVRTGPIFTLMDLITASE